MSVSFLKKLAVLTGFLVLLWVIYLYRQVPHQSAPFAKAVPAATRVLIQQGAQKAQLSKIHGVWKVQLSSATTAPIDDVKLKNLLTSVESVQLEEEISNRADRLADYHVDDAAGARLAFADTQGKTLAEGIFGKQAPDFAHCYFRFPEKLEVYLARGVLPGDLGRPEPNYWRSKQLIDVAEDKIQNIVIDGPSFKTTLVSPHKDFWLMNDKDLQPGAADALIGTLAHLKADDFVDPAAAGLSYEGLMWGHVTIRGPQGQIDLRLGPPDPKTKQSIVSTGKETGFALLSEKSVQAILLKPSAFKTK